MKQTINLLPAKAKHSKDLLAFNNVVIVLALTFFVGISVVSGLWWQGKSLQDQNDLQFASNTLLQNQLSQLTNQLVERKTPLALTEQLSNLQSQIQAMQQVSDLSITIDKSKSQGFLSTLQRIDKSLAAQAKLERLQINSDKTLDHIAGELANISALPAMLSSLKEQRLFSRYTKTSGLNNGSFYRFEVSSTLSTNGGNQ
jgi:hypothetical protein